MGLVLIFLSRRRRRFSLQNQRRCSLISYLSLLLRQLVSELGFILIMTNQRNGDNPP
jgi:hypothetical protein